MNKKFLKQRVAAIGCIIVGIGSAVLLGDATASVVFVPLGMYFLFTKELIIGAE